MIDYTIYGDTDSAFIDINKFINDQGLENKFNSLNEEQKILWVKKIASAIENFVNNKSYSITQLKQLNSNEHEFKISFKSENVFKAGFWVSKKKYFLYIIDEEGVRPKEPLSVTGLETVRSDTPICVKPYLKNIMMDILLNLSDEELREKIAKYKEELRSVSPEDIAQNIGIHNMNEYLSENNSYGKGTPRHIKGVAALNEIAKSLNIMDKIENINEGDKAKVVYIKPNRWNAETLTFIKWLPDFDNAGIEIDYDKMIDKIFIKKIEMFLEKMDKLELLTENSKIIGEFFI